MSSAGRSTFVLLLAIMFFCSREGAPRPVIQEGASFLETYVYPLNVFDEVFIGSVLGIIFGTRLAQRINILVPVIVFASLYMVARTMLHHLNFPYIAEAWSYHGLVQTGLVCTIIWLAQRVARNHIAVDQLLKSFLLNGDKPGRASKQALEEAHARLQYCRRHDHPVGVLVLKPQATLRSSSLGVHLERILREAAKGILSVKLAGVIDRTLRQTDVLVEQPNRGYYAVVCPETNRERLSELSKRLQREVSSVLGVHLEVGTAFFPSEGLTYEDLVRQALAEIGETGRALGTRPEIGVQPREEPV